MDADSDDLLGAAQTAPPATLAPAYVPTITDSWVPHPSDPLRFVKAEIRQLLLRRGALSIAQLPEEYLKFYRRPLTQALKMVDSQYTPESARGGKPSGRARKATPLCARRARAPYTARRDRSSDAPPRARRRMMYPG